jgi:hypothetical protein
VGRLKKIIGADKPTHPDVKPQTFTNFFGKLIIHTGLASVLKFKYILA